MSDKSWREAYAIRNKIIQQRGINAREDSGAVANAASIANAGFRDSIKQDSSVSLRPDTEIPDYSQLEQVPLSADGAKKREKKLKDDAYKETIEKGGFEGFMGSVGQALDKPVIKNIANGISVGMYSSANTIKNGLEEGKGLADKAVMQKLTGKGGPTAGDIGSAFVKAMPIVGVGEGIQGAFAGNTEKQIGNGSNIREVQRLMGTPENELDGGANGAIQGWGGLAMDIGLDPLTYMSFGTAPLIKGAVRGAVQGGERAKTLAKAGVAESLEKGTGVAPKLTKIAENPKGRVKTAISEAKIEKTQWDLWRSLGKEDKQVIRSLKKDKAVDATGLSVGAIKYIEGMDGGINAANKAQLDALAKGNPETKAADEAFAETIVPTVNNPIDDIAASSVDNAVEAIPKIADEEITPTGFTPMEEAPIKEPLAPIVPKEDVSLESLIDDVPVPTEKIATTPMAKAMEDIADGAPVVAAVKTRAELTDTVNKINAITGTMGKPIYKDASTWHNSTLYTDEAKKMAGIKPEHMKIESIQDLANLRTSVSPAQIKAAIKRDGGITKAAMTRILELTGNGRNADGVIPNLDKVIDDFIALRSSAVKELREANKKALAEINRKPTRAEEVLGKQGEKLAEAKTTVADTVEELASSPTAMNEAVQVSVRRGEYADAVRASTELIEDARFIEAFKGDKYGIANIGHRAVQAAIGRQTKGAKFKTDGNFNTNTADSMLTGNAWRADVWGTHSQFALHTSIIREIADLAKSNASLQASNVKRTLYVAALKVADKELRAAGVEPFLGAAAGSRKANLSLYDVVATLGTHAKATLTDTLFSGAAKGFQPSDFMDAAEILVKGRATGLSEDKITTAIKQIFTDTKVFKGAEPDKVTGLSKVEAATAALMQPKIYEELSIRSVVNHAYHNTKLAKEVDDLAEGTIQTLKEMQSTSSVGEAMNVITAQARLAVKGLSKEDIAKARAAYTMKMATIISETEQAALNQVNVRVAEAFKATPPVKVKEFINTKAKVESNGKTNLANTKVGAKVSNAAASARLLANSTHPKDLADIRREVADAAPQPRPADPVAGTDEVFEPEYFDMVSAEIATKTMKQIHPIQSLVNPRLGISPENYRAINSGLHSIARQQNVFHGTLLNQMGKRGHAALQEDFTLIQKLSAEHVAANNMDVAFKLPDDVAESTREMFEIMNVLFDTSMKNIYARNGIGADHFNAHMRAAGMPKEWSFIPEASPAENSLLWTQWKGIEKNGVMDFMSKVHSASVKASQDIAIAASFTEKFGKKVYEPGYVKLIWSGKNQDASLYHLLDRTQYYPKELASEIRTLDNLLTESRSMSTKGWFGKFIVNTFDPITNALKASQTTVRPGHWVVNTSGDLLRNQLAGVHGITPYKHSFEIMRAAGLKPEDFIGNIVPKSKFQQDLTKYTKDSEATHGFDLTSNAARQAEAAKTGKTYTGDQGGVNVYIGGKKVKILYSDFAKLTNDGIAIPPHRGGGGGAPEDRLMGEAMTTRFAKGVTKVTDVVTDNKHFSFNKGAAFRDNFSRIALAVDFASKRQWKNVDEMKAAMEGHVTKWSPLSTDFTAFEAKVARRTVLYYTWLRGIIPRVIDSAMTKPGVTTMVPKAMYNMAYANGLHPESVGNPFPEEFLTPEYYSRNILGPQWMDDYGTWGFNPSSPVIEVANTFSGINPMHPVKSALSVGKTLGSMATPFTKIPVELTTGQSNNIPIESNSQYLLDNLGGSWVGSASRATGKTLSEKGIVDRSDTAHKNTPEDQANHAKLQAINLGLGGKLTDYQSDGAIRSAVWAKKDEAKKKAEGK